MMHRFISFSAGVAALFVAPVMAQAITNGGTFSVPGLDTTATPNLVTPGDTFTVDVAGFNSAGTVGYLLVPDTTVTFGTPATATGYGGQAITVTSGETINGATTTDTITISTPTNFLSGSKVSGTTIASLQFDIGDANSGSNTLDYSLPVTGNTATGYTLYNSGTNFTLTPVTTLTNSSMSLSAVEGINAGGSALYSFAFNTFSYSITYNTVPVLVPEPSTYAAAGIGLLSLGSVLLRRNRKAATR